MNIWSHESFNLKGNRSVSFCFMNLVFSARFNLHIGDKKCERLQQEYKCRMGAYLTFHEEVV